MAGSIEKRGKDSYRLIASGGRGPDGKRIKHTKTIKAPSDREARKELAKFVAEIQKGQYIEPSKLSLAEFAARWVRDYGEKNLSPTTLKRYREYLNSRILPAMGHLKLEQIKPLHLLEFYRNLQEDGIRKDGKKGGLSEQTILHHHRLISAILEAAVKWQLIALNPASRVQPPKVSKKEMKYYDEEQTLKLLAALEHAEPKYKVLVTLAIATGLRRGELLGLEWSHIDFERNTIEIKQSSLYVEGKGVITKTPKNKSSERMISAPDSVMALLREYKRIQNEERLKLGDIWQHSDRLFTTWDGKPMHPNTVNNWFPKFLRKNKLDPLPFHGLRHTAATLLIGKGVHVKTISNRLGHANISTTMDIYGHALQSSDQEAADKINDFFTPANEKREQA
ncbi:site-specific integrase [Pueribacillus theae]|uniref:Site-specific integrase n=1 Tax=Pueribacillus theae TaxID=2171751 RepID=A0A2U1K548_9BACI|nr:site-specific integrase [Pueribacillus theae]PWA12078.1 site-specific integrase [Pueribacillus theae]